jgi:hypothetical protein
MTPTPCRAWDQYAVAVVANCMYYIFDGIAGAGSEHYMLRFHRMDRMKIIVEEPGKCFAKLWIAIGIWQCEHLFAISTIQRYATTKRRLTNLVRDLVFHGALEEFE